MNNLPKKQYEEIRANQSNLPSRAAADWHFMAIDRNEIQNMKL
jgi:hypothetical protein